MRSFYLLLSLFIAAFAQTELPSTPTQSSDSLFVVVEKQAEYPGGLRGLIEFIDKNRIIPKDARREGVDGKVFVEFVINRDGSIDDESVKVFERTGNDGSKAMIPESLKNAACRAEAIRLIRLCPDWIPASQRGKPVKSKFVMPIRFKA